MNERTKELAEQAGLKFSKDWGECYTGNVQIERFAELVRQDYANQFITDAERDENIRSEERKHCAEHYLAIMRDAVEQAILKEREACAKLCEEQDEYGCGQYAKAIRGRTE
jgi:hypothetical protein